MDNFMTQTPISYRIINWVMFGVDELFEKNKIEFIKKHNPELYKKLYERNRK